METDNLQDTAGVNRSNGHSGVPQSFPSPEVTEKISNLIAQLKYKQTFQDEDSVGQVGGILSGPEVSKVMETLFGPDLKDLPAETKQTLKGLEAFLKQFIKLSKATGGPKAKEALTELMHNPEHIVFHQILCNEPKELAGLAYPVVEQLIRKEELKEQLEKDIKDIKLKRREVAKDIDLAKKNLESLKSEQTKIREKMNPDNRRRLQIALDSYKSEADKLEVASSVRQGSATMEDVETLLSNFEEIKRRHEKARKELLRLSADRALPCNVLGAKNVLMNRQTYLEALLEQISNLNDHSKSSLDNSVFK